MVAATEASAVRCAVSVFAATTRSTVPDPVRPVPLGTVMYVLRLRAVHAHEDCVVTLMVSVVPAAGAVGRSGVTV